MIEQQRTVDREAGRIDAIERAMVGVPERLDDLYRQISSETDAKLSVESRRAQVQAAWSGVVAVAGIALTLVGQVLALPLW